MRFDRFSRRTFDGHEEFLSSISSSSWHPAQGILVASTLAECGDKIRNLADLLDNSGLYRWYIQESDHYVSRQAITGDKKVLEGDAVVELTNSMREAFEAIATILEVAPVNVEQGIHSSKRKMKRFTSQWKHAAALARRVAIHSEKLDHYLRAALQ